MKTAVRVIAAGLAATCAGSALAAGEVKVAEIRAYLFLERSGKLSDNIVGSPDAYFNTIIGEGGAGEPANNVLVDVVFAGDASTPSEASGTVVISQTLAGKKVVTRKTVSGFLFEKTGTIHKAFFLEDATCEPLLIEAKAGTTTKTARINFRCGE